MKDSICSRGDLIATPLARVRLLAFVMVKQTILATLRAIDSFRVSFVSNVIQAYIIIRERGLKVFQSELHHRAFGHGGYLL